MKAKTLYYAVSRRGQGVVFTDMPVRIDKLGIWSGTIEGIYNSVVADMEAEGFAELPLISWNDEPVELKLTLSNGH